MLTPKFFPPPPVRSLILRLYFSPRSIRDASPLEESPPRDTCSGMKPSCSPFSGITLIAPLSKRLSGSRTTSRRSPTEHLPHDMLTPLERCPGNSGENRPTCERTVAVAGTQRHRLSVSIAGWPFFQKVFTLMSSRAPLGQSLVVRRKRLLNGGRQYLTAIQRQRHFRRNRFIEVTNGSAI